MTEFDQERIVFIDLPKSSEKKIFINFTFMILSSYFIPVIHCHSLFNSFLSFCLHNRLMLRLGYGL